MTDEPTDEQIRRIYEDAHIRAPRSVSPYERRAIARRALFEAGRSAGRSDGAEQETGETIDTAIPRIFPAPPEGSTFTEQDL